MSSYSLPARPSTFLIELEFLVSGRLDFKGVELPATETGAIPGSGC